MNKALLFSMLTGAAIALSGCGDTWGQRAVSGGAIGAGVGAAAAHATGHDWEQGAVIGGVAGAGAGAATGR